MKKELTMGKTLLLTLIFASLSLVGCGKGDGSGESMAVIDELASVVNKTAEDENYDPTEDFLALLVDYDKSRVQDKGESGDFWALEIQDEWGFFLCTDYTFNSQKVTSSNKTIVTLDTPRKTTDVEWITVFCSQQWIKEQTKVRLQRDPDDGNLKLVLGR